MIPSSRCHSTGDSESAAFKEIYKWLYHLEAGLEHELPCLSLSLNVLLGLFMQG